MALPCPSLLLLRATIAEANDGEGRGRQRHRGDASEATAAVLERRLRYRLGKIEWQRIDASGRRAVVTRNAEQALAAAAEGPR